MIAKTQFVRMGGYRKICVLSKTREVGSMIQDEKFVIFTQLFETIKGLLIHCFDHCFVVSNNKRVKNVTQPDGYHRFYFALLF